MNESYFKSFSPCPLWEDILKNWKVLKFQPYIRVPRKFRDEFSNLFLPVFEDFFNTNVWFLVCLSDLGIQNDSAGWNQITVVRGQESTVTRLITQGVHPPRCNLERCTNERSQMKATESMDCEMVIWWELEQRFQTWTFHKFYKHVDINLANTRARRVLLGKEMKKSTYFLCPNILSCTMNFFPLGTWGIYCIKEKDLLTKYSKLINVRNVLSACSSLILKI